tara:strand:- start:536 stop:670 length:135 start_codon:yes stop_codon:yes gene_type:complete
VVGHAGVHDERVPSEEGGVDGERGGASFLLPQFQASVLPLDRVY